MPTSHGLRFEDTRFWVVHRRREYGPFDYEWSRDLGGIEMVYQGEKFGEFCGADSICADLKPYRLPMTVVNVASIVLGCVIQGIVTGSNSRERSDQLVEHLNASGYGRFSPAE